jgi:hypothetical protein
MSGGELTMLRRCPKCHYAFSTTAAFMALDYCPRCAARRHVQRTEDAADAALVRRYDLVFDARRGTAAGASSEPTA